MMTRQWLRAWSLAFSGGGKDETSWTNENDPNGLKLVFQIESHTLQSPDLAQFVVFNPDPGKAKAVQQEFKEVTFRAGYQDGIGEVFKGSIVETQYGEKIDGFTTSLLRIWCANSDLAYNQSKVNTTLAAGHTPQDIVDTCFKAMQPYGVSMGQILGVDLSAPRFPRGATFVGLARDFLREVSLSKNANWTLSNSQLSIIGKDAKMPGGPIVLTTNTIIEQPILRPEGVIVKCLLNSQITVNSLVQIKSNIISPSINGSPILPGLTEKQTLLQNQLNSDGIYRVLHIQIDGDSRGNDWTMTLTTIGNGNNVNTAQAGLGYQ